jgi:cellulose synthase/poly-beta-1,6-N-acetylglucosamine synthase-like glycosyltransferase
MELFSFVETFFFISLAITFVLIMMLIYHFRERLTIVEKKTNTMFDIITNVVNELNFVRNCLVLKNTENPPSNIFSQSIQPSSFSNKIIVSDNEDNIDSDCDSEYSDNSDETEKIKIINIDLHSNKEEDENIELEELNTLSEDEDIYNVTDFEAYSNMEPTNNEVEMVADVNSSNTMKIVKEELNQTYRKMDIQSLRNLVTEKNISADVKKLKKIELIDLLLSNSNM